MSRGICCTSTATSASAWRCLTSCGLDRSSCIRRPRPSTGGPCGQLLLAGDPGCPPRLARCRSARPASHVDLGSRAGGSWHVGADRAATLDTRYRRARGLPLRPQARGRTAWNVCSSRPGFQVTGPTPKALDGEPMRRIIIWLASTVTVVVLLFGYHTSTNKTTSGTTEGGTSGSTTSAGNEPGASPSSPSSGSSGSPSTKITTYTGAVTQTRWGRSRSRSACRAENLPRSRSCNTRPVTQGTRRSTTTHC
jgi:hypothetical protein